MLALQKLLLLPVTMLKIATSTSPRSTICNAPTVLIPSCRKIQGIHKGYFTAIISIFFFFLFLIYAHLLVFGYTEYKGKQKEIFEAAINGV